MNYLAHGFRFLDRPHFLIGTAVPDWLSVCDRSLRIDGARARDLSQDTGGLASEIWAGIARHLEDDLWFHSNPLFEEVARQIARTIRTAFPRPKNFRASFLGHVLTELLLDATLIEEEPSRVDRYYESLARVSTDAVEGAVLEVVGRVPENLTTLMRRFGQIQFLREYGDDEGLLLRLTQVARRAGLPPLPTGLDRTFAPARALVASHAEGLLPRPR